MEDRKRTIFAIIIACVVLAALLYSFGLSLFSSRPELILADPNAAASQNPGGKDPGEQGGIPVDVEPDTVQLVVADLERYTSYRRTVLVEYRWGEGGVGVISARVWAHDGWVRTDTTLSSGTVEHSVVGDGRLWLWYDEGKQIYEGSANEMTADLMQRLPTYEDVLKLDPKDIIRADYGARDGETCIYVESRQQELGYQYRYWISVSSGLLIAAETVCDGEVVYSMTSREMVSPLTDVSGHFVLPDGTDLINPYQDQAGA